jgi:hypothetical protein
MSLRGALAAMALAGCALGSLAAAASAAASSSPTWQPVYQAASYPDGQYTSVGGSYDGPLMASFGTVP